jgi:hypothetical protein
MGKNLYPHKMTKRTFIFHISSLSEEFKRKYSTYSGIDKLKPKTPNHFLLTHYLADQLFCRGHTNGL